MRFEWIERYVNKRRRPDQTKARLPSFVSIYLYVYLFNYPSINTEAYTTTPACPLIRVQKTVMSTTTDWAHVRVHSFTYVDRAVEIVIKYKKPAAQKYALLISGCQRFAGRPGSVGMIGWMDRVEPSPPAYIDISDVGEWVSERERENKKVVDR